MFVRVTVTGRNAARPEGLHEFLRYCNDPLRYGSCPYAYPPAWPPEERGTTSKRRKDG